MTKADVIRSVILANPEGKPIALAKVASKQLGGKVKPFEISNYKTPMKKAGLLNGKPQPATPAPTVSPAVVRAAPKAVPVGRQTMTVTETVELVKELVGQIGKDELKKLVDVL